MKPFVCLLTACGLLAAIPIAGAQQGGDEPGRPAMTKTKKAKATGAESLVTRMMQFDENKDGKLTKAEVTDERLHRLFARADADHDGIVTGEELTALAAREPAGGRGGFGGPGGPGGFFGPPGGGPGGPGGFRGGPPRPGEILPGMLRDRLELTPEQSKQVDALQKEVDGRLEKILNEDQKAQLKEMRDRGPGGFGPGGRRGGPGGGGPPPGGPDGDRPPPPPGGPDRD
jgi:EF hand